MPVITVDTLVEGVPRADVLAWLSEADHHIALLARGFDRIEAIGDGAWRCELVAGPRRIKVDYTFREIDERHGGRRVRVELGGRRTRGHLSYSLRTVKPSTNTLVTLHADYRAGTLLGPMLDALQTRAALEEAFRGMLAELRTSLQPAT